MALDTSIIGITSALFFWPIIIEPTIDQNITADGMTIALSLAYPILDLILLFFVAQLLFRKLNLPGHEALKLLVLGCCVLHCYRYCFLAPESGWVLYCRWHY